MQTLLTRLAPHDLDLKGQIAACFCDNPFLEADFEALQVRFSQDADTLGAVLKDLCRCGVLSANAGRYCFSPEPDMWAQVASWRASLRSDEAAVRQQVVELETLARLGEKLAVSQEEVAAILEIVPSGVVLLDRFGHLVKSNAAAKALLGEKGLADVCGRLGMDLDRVLAQACYVEVDGRPPLSATTRPFRVSGSDVGVVIALQDLTARRELEAEADRMREAFFSMIRHELRKPLMTVERFLASDEAGTIEVALARSAAAHLGAMIDDMLLLARLERDPLAVAMADGVSLRFLLAGADLAFRARAQEAGVALQVAQPEADVVFRGDASRLGQVIGNLIDNALKFSPRGGQVFLKGGREGDRVWVSVRDSGPGIPEAERDQVFDKFYQAPNGAGRQPGLGLGLAICAQIVKAHGGSIDVADAPGGGALITVFLPFKGGA